MTTIYTEGSLDDADVAYAFRVFQCVENLDYRSRSGVDVIPIRCQWWRDITIYNPVTGAVDTDDSTFLGKKTLKLRFSRERASKDDAKTAMKRFARFKRVISRSPREANKLRAKLRRHLFIALGISEEKHPLIIDKVFDMLQVAVPNKIIEVQIVEVIFRVSEVSYYMYKLIPATESFIQALEEVSPPDDGLECAICREVIAHKKDTCSSSITRLPCSHYYHRDCIVPWLHINHVCPTCRHPNAPSS